MIQIQKKIFTEYVSDSNNIRCKKHIPLFYIYILTAYIIFNLYREISQKQINKINYTCRFCIVNDREIQRRKKYRKIL